MTCSTSLDPQRVTTGMSLPESYSASASTTRSSATDQKVQMIAQKTLNRPLHEGALEGLLVHQDGACLVESIRDNVALVTGEHVGPVNTPELAIGPETMAMGALHFSRALHVMKQVAKTGDLTATRVGITRLFRGPADILRGASRTTTVGLQLAESIAPQSTAVHNIAKLQILQKLGYVTAAGSGVTAIALSGLCLSYLAENRSAARQLNKSLEAGECAAGVKFLREMRILTDADKEKVFERFFSKEPVPAHKKFARMIARKVFGDQESEKDKKLKQALYKAAHGDTSAVDNLVSEYALDPLLGGSEEYRLSDKEKEEIEARVGNETFKTIQKRITGMLGADHMFSDADIKTFTFHVCALYIQELDNETARKESIFSRVMGSDTIRLLDSHKGKKVGELSKVEAEAVIKAAKSSLRSNLIILCFGMLAATLWMGVIITAQITTAGMYGIAETVIGLVISLIALGIDGYFLHMEYKNNHALTKDKILMFVTTLMTAAAGISVVALAQSLANQIINGVLTFIWLGLLLYTLYQWRSQPKEETQQAPAASAASNVGVLEDSGVGVETAPLLGST